MIQNITAIIVIIVFLLELYFSAAGAAHRKKKLIKGWNKAEGVIIDMEKKFDQVSRKNYTELTIEGPENRKVYAKVSNMFNIYETGEKVDLMEKDGYHRFLGNDRVDAKGKKEQLIGVIPILILMAIVVVINLLS